MAIVCWNLIGRKPHQSALLKRELDRGINSKLQQRVKSLEQKINNIKMSIHHIKIDNEHVSDRKSNATKKRPPTQTPFP